LFFKAYALSLETRYLENKKAHPDNETHILEVKDTCFKTKIASFQTKTRFKNENIGLEMYAK